MSRGDIYASRAAKAKSVATYVRAALIIAVMAAAWQDRALWPFLHDQMQVAYAYGTDLYINSEDARGQIASLTGFDSQSSAEGRSAVVDTILKLRQ